MRITLNKSAARRHRMKPAILKISAHPEDEDVTLELRDSVNPMSIRDGEISVKLWLTPAEFTGLLADLAAFAKVMDL